MGMDKIRRTLNGFLIYRNGLFKLTRHPEGMAKYYKGIGRRGGIESDCLLEDWNGLLRLACEG